MCIRKSIFIVLFVLITPFIASAQEDSLKADVFRLELIDGSVLVGEIQSEDERNVQILTLSQLTIRIPKDQIVKKTMIKEDHIVEGEVWLDDPNNTRLLFAPTGRALGSGQGYFSAYQIFFPFLAVGVTDYFSLSGGMSLFPGADKQLFYIAPKITAISKDGLDLAAGMLYLGIPDEESAGIAYGVGTYGSGQAAFTLGAGFGFSGGDFADTPILVIGGEVRTGKRFKLITENWISGDGDFSIWSGAIRFFGEKLAADFGLFFISEMDDGLPFIPWIGFAYNFGN